jgi:DNA-binding NarL/FixJ family response regulator
MLKIILAEDHNIVRNGIKILLEAEEDIEVIGEATNGQEVLDFLNAGTSADLILSDINMPVMDGIMLLEALKEQHPQARVILLSMLDNEEYITKAFNEGAAGYLLKSAGAEELIFALRHVHSGNKYLSSELSIKLLERVNSSVSTTTFIKNDIEFSAREIEVLQLIAQGLTNLEMSEKLFLSKRTIEGHRQNLIEKTGSKNTAALIRFAVLSGIVQ